MKYSVHDGKLILKSENEGDNAILSEIWLHPLVIEYIRNNTKFMDNRFFPDELITSEPKRIDVEVVK